MHEGGRLATGDLFALRLAQCGLNGRIFLGHSCNVCPRQSKQVGICESACSVVCLVIGQHKLCSDHLAPHNHSTPTTYHPALHYIHLLCLIVGMDDLLPLRVCLSFETQRDLNHKFGRPARKKGDRGNPVPALQHRHLPTQSGAHQPKQVTPFTDRSVLRTVAEVCLQPAEQLRRNLILLPKLRQLVHQLVKLRRLFVQVGDDATYATHDVRENRRAKDHSQDCENALRLGIGQNVAVANGGHRHERPIEGRDEHVRRAHANKIAYILPLIESATALATVLGATR
mmetsp:Transcript_3086/g.5616  ORF Transcript_3086/g.5616 Transcript_3086/m.5616 type:complete len:285 (+) Transcript_3086:757-1611(+)